MDRAIRRPGGNWSVGRIDELQDYQTVLYEIDMLRFCYGRIVRPPDGARDADVWAYLESFLVHYRNLLDFFGKVKDLRPDDLTLLRPEEIWSTASGAAPSAPAQKELDAMRGKGLTLREKYEVSPQKPGGDNATISRCLQHCTTYRRSHQRWYPVGMMAEIEELAKSFERFLPEFKPATNSAPIDRQHFCGGFSVSTHSDTSASR